jgi:hypothetical protein
MNSQQPESKEQNYSIVGQVITNGMNILQPKKGELGALGKLLQAGVENPDSEEKKNQD